MTDPMMSLDQFQDLLDRHGDQADGWPSGLRSQAEALLVRSSEAQALLAEARCLRARVVETAPLAPPGLADRIFRAAMGDDPGEKAE